MLERLFPLFTEINVEILPLRVVDGPSWGREDAPKEEGPARTSSWKRSSRALKGVALCAEYHGAGVSEATPERSTEDAYTAPQAGRVLGISDRRVRQMLEAGDLEGDRDASGKWWIPQRVVHEVLEDRGSPRGRRSSSPSSPRVDIAAEPPAAPDRAPDDRESVRELAARIEDLSYRLGRTEARAELTERAESSVREERDRLVGELEEERAERRRLAERLEQLEEERQGPSTEGRPEGFPPPGPTEGDVGGQRSSWWRRLFGG